MLPASFLKAVGERWMLFFLTGCLSDTLLSGELSSPPYQLLLAWVLVWVPPQSLRVSLLNFMLLVALSVLLLKQLEGIGATPYCSLSRAQTLSKWPCFSWSVNAAVFSCLLADRTGIVSESPGTCCQVSVYTCAVTVGLLAHGSYHVCLHSIMTKTTICKSRLRNQFLGGPWGWCFAQI